MPLPETIYDLDPTEEQMRATALVLTAEGLRVEGTADGKTVDALAQAVIDSANFLLKNFPVKI